MLHRDQIEAPIEVNTLSVDDMDISILRQEVTNLRDRLSQFECVTEAMVDEIEYAIGDVFAFRAMQRAKALLRRE